MASSMKGDSATSPPSTTDGQQPTSREDDTTDNGNLYPPLSAGETKSLKEIFDKEYEEGDAGRTEALYDLQNMFDELEKQKVISGFDILTPYTTPHTKVVNPSMTMKMRSQRDEALTLRPSVGLFGRDQSEVKISSLPNLKNLIPSRSEQSSLMKDTTASLPALTTSQPKHKSRSRKTKSKRTGRRKSNRKQGERGAKGPEICVSDAIDIVQKDLELVTSTEFRRPPFSSSVTKEGNTTDADIDDAWKADVNRVTRARTSSKPFTRSGEDEILQLKYKPPIWPHQQCLNQILDAVPHLTCLILDGSEIQFLRDLGSSLQSLETLSICKCGLRSVDGTFGFPNLRTFIASDNKIQHPTQCSYLPYLNYLDLSGNPIEDINNFVHLRSCRRLRSLKLHCTPVSKIPDFITRMKTMIPQVKDVFPVSTYRKSTKDKNRMKEDETVGDPLQAMMRQDLNMVYKKIVDNPKPPGIGYQHFRTSKNTMESLLSATSPGTGTSTDDNFDSVLINSIPRPKYQEDMTTESYITEIEEDYSTNFTSDTQGKGDITTDFSVRDTRNLFSTASSIPPSGESSEEIFVSATTTPEIDDTETDGYDQVD